MALIHLEGFEGFGTTTGTAGTTNVQNGLSAKYSGAFNNANGVRVYTPGWGSGYGLGWGTNTFAPSNYIDFALPSGPTSVYVGFAYKSASPMSQQVLIGFRNLAGGQIHMRLDTVEGGGLRIGRANLTTQLNAITGVIQQGRWHYIECYVLINDTTGAYTVKVNGTTVMSGTNVDTRDGGTGTLDTIRISGGSGSADTIDGNVMIDDLYILDTTGGAPQNTFLGPIKIEGILPDGNGDTNNFTASAGSNYQCVDENPPNDDTDYVSSGTSTHVDLYTHGNLSVVNGTIFGTQVNLSHKLDAAGTLTIRAKAKHSTTVGDGTSTAVTNTTYQYLRHIFSVNPSTSAAWTPTEVNAAQFGVEVV